MIERIGALKCLGEVEGFLEQIAKDGRSLTEEEWAEMARQKIKLQRGVSLR